MLYKISRFMTLKTNMVSQFDGCVVGRLQTRILEGEGNSEVASTMRLNINAKQASVRVRELVRDTGSNLE
jgi:hypothetical protein